MASKKLLVLVETFVNSHNGRFSYCSRIVYGGLSQMFRESLLLLKKEYIFTVQIQALIMIDKAIFDKTGHYLFNPSTPIQSLSDLYEVLKRDDITVLWKRYLTMP